jgi:glycosyltransferase involved in cell wall biosynthesis
MLPFILGGVALAVTGYGIGKFFEDEVSCRSSKADLSDVMDRYEDIKSKLCEVNLKELQLALKEIENFEKSDDILVYDLYPDALVNFNYITKDGWANKVFTHFTKKMFKKANTLYTLTPELAKETSKYAEGKEIKIVPIWTNNEFFPQIDRNENLIFKKLGIAKDTFVICYSGNLGKTHPIEKLVDLAHAFKNEPNFYFLVIGGGHKYELIHKLIEEQKLTNIQLLPWQPIELLPHNMQVGNLNVVTLDEGAADLSIPSKTFNLLSVGKPILAICSKRSALANLLERSNCGRAFEANEVNEIKNFIYQLQNEPETYKAYSENAKKASNNFTKENAMQFL